MSQKFYLVVLKTGLLLGFLSFFLVNPSLLFPFITGKQIYFNILIEILAVFWLAFIIKYPLWNPFKKTNKNFITYGLIAFGLAMLASLAVTVDFNLSFWGDAERMLGIFPILHFFVYYLILITVMKDWRDWKVLLMASVLTTTIVAIKGLNGPSHSFIGNTAYVAGIMIFNIYFAFFLFFKEKTAWRWLYIVPVILMWLSFQRANISGAYVGLFFGALCFLFLMGILYNGRKTFSIASRNITITGRGLRITTILITILAIFSIVFAFNNKDHVLVAWIDPIQDISIQKNTFQTRLISWQAAVKDFKNHWVLGVGHGNYATIFDKYFQASFFDYSRSETYFDRAHNNIIDIGSTTGVVGLAAYLSIFVGVAIYLIKTFIRQRIGLVEFSLLSALVIAYFVQNLAVFDSLVTYISLMILLAYIHWLANNENDEKNSVELLKTQGDRSLINKEIYTLALAGIISLVVMYNYNLLPLKMLKGTILGQIELDRGRFTQGIEEYRKALSIGTILDRDSAFTLTRTVIARSMDLQNLPPEEVKKNMEFVIEQAKANVSLNPGDSLYQMQLARVYEVAAKFIRDQQLQNEYISLALQSIERSIAISPERIPTHFVKSQILLNTGQRDKAIATVKQASLLNENYFESNCQLAQMYLIVKEISAEDEAAGYENLDKCLDNGGYNYLAAINPIKRGINYYIDKGDAKKVLGLYEQLVAFEPNNPNHWISLAKLYVQMAQWDRAIKSVERAAQIDKSLEADVDEFIKNIEEARTQIQN